MRSGIEAVEDFRFAEAAVDAGFESQTFADVVGRREGQDRGGHQRSVDQSHGEQNAGELAGERNQGAGGFGDIGDLAVLRVEDSRGAGYHDEERNHVGHDAAEDHVDAAESVVALRNALLDDRRLQVELHPGRDGGADQADDHDQIAGVGIELRDDRVRERQFPVRFREKCRDRIGEINQRKKQQDAFHGLVRAAHDDGPDQRRADGDRDVFADTEDAHARGEAGELGRDVAEVGESEDDHGEEGHAQAELFADEIGEAFAGDGAHARGHFLHHDQRDGGGDQGPEQRVAVLRAGLRVGEDAAGIVIDVGGDEAGADDGEEREHPVAHDVPLRERRTRTGAWPDVFRYCAGPSFILVRWLLFAEFRCEDAASRPRAARGRDCRPGYRYAEPSGLRRSL